MRRAALLAAALTGGVAGTPTGYDTSATWPNANAGRQDQAMDVHGRMLPPAPAAVTILGLTRPVSVTWEVTPSGQTTVLIGEKAGVIKSQATWTGTPTVVLLDITTQVASWGDHGMTGIQVHRGYLYVSYMVAQPPWGSLDCEDHGQMDGRPVGTVTGCPVSGRLSRWPFSNGVITGPEQIVVEGKDHRYCCQFSTHSVTGPIVGPDGEIKVAWGDGAAFTTVDSGQLGANPCNDTAPYTGAFRSQDPTRLNGKLISVNPDTLAWRIVSSGHRNPFRLGTYKNKLFATETGWYHAEEINEIVEGNNYGWPCREGIDPAPEYMDQTIYAVACNQGQVFTNPAIYYDHPVPAPPGNVMSISAVGGNELVDRIYFADYTQGWLKSVNADGYTDERTELTDAFGVELKMSPMGMVYVNHQTGQVRSVPAAGGAPPAFSASSSPVPPLAEITVPPILSWTPGAPTAVTFSGASNVEGREGAKWAWAASLLYNCSPGTDTCTALPLAFNPYGGRTFTIDVPPYAGTLEVTLNVTSYAGLAAVAQTVRAAAVGVTECTCTGSRITSAVFLGSASPTPSPSRGWLAAAAHPKSTGVDTSSPLFIALVASFSTLLTLVVLGAVLYYTGAATSVLGLARAPSTESAARPLRRGGRSTAGTASEGGGLDEPRVAAGTAAAAAAASSAAGVGSVATRRSAIIPPLDGGDGATTAAAPAARVSPSDGTRQAGGRSPNKTPTGARRV